MDQLKEKRDKHPELFETDDDSESGRKSLLDALFEDGVIPTYSFPKNVVSTYISGTNGKYQVERGLDIAIGEYAPGRAIVVDKTTYQIGGFYYPGGNRNEATASSPARPFIQDANYRKSVLTCDKCGWFGLLEDHMEQCPFCGNPTLTAMREMLRPWGFAPMQGRLKPPSWTRNILQYSSHCTLPFPKQTTYPKSVVVPISGWLYVQISELLC